MAPRAVGQHRPWTSGSRIGDLVRTRRFLGLHGRPEWRRPQAVPTVALFDVFDTLLVRSELRADAAWAHMATRVAARTGRPRTEVLEARRFAARATARRHGGCAVLEEIHVEMCRRLGLDDRWWSTTASDEIDAELALCRPVVAGVRLLEAARDHVGRAVFVSDMHLPGAVIRSMLDRHGIWRDGDVLWVSGEARARKADGRLFVAVARSEGFDLRAAVHVGDQPVADRAAPRWFGVDVRPFRGATANRYERTLADAATPGDLADRMAGASRSTRVSTEAAHDPIRSVAVGVMGPLLAGFSLWLLRTAQRLELDTLHFLSRDGQVLLEVTEPIARRLGCDVELRYLHGGRLAWTLAAADVERDDEWERLVDTVVLRYSRITPLGVAMRLGLDAEAISGPLRRDPRTPMTPEDRGRAIGLLHEPGIRRAAARSSARQRDEARGYLGQQGLIGAPRAAVVDVGWVGSTMGQLARILQPDPAPLALFIGFTGDRSQPPGGHRAYLWGASDGHPTAERPALPTIVEMCCQGRHGPVAGYRHVDGRWEPRLLSPTSTAVRSWPLEEMHRSIVDFVEVLSEDLVPDDLDADVRDPVLTNLEQFARRPDRAEATAWGDLVREEDPQADSTFPVARAFRGSDLARTLRPGHAAGRNLAWPEAALARTDPPMRWLASTTLAAGALARRWSRRRPAP